MSLEITRGESIDFDFVINDEEGNALDISSLSFRIGASKRGSTALSFDASIGSGITITDAANGEFNLTVTDTTGFTAGSYDFEISYTDENGIITKPDTVNLLVKESIF